jgi:hypothetical protein
MTPSLLTRFDVHRGARHRVAMMHAECPIEQALYMADAQAQHGLLEEIWKARPADSALLIADPKRLRVLGRTERALCEPVAAMRKRYGPSLIVEPPAVRYAHGTPVLEPYMRLLMCGPGERLDVFQQDLARRRSKISRLHQHRGRFILEAEAPLADLLGYADRVDALGHRQIDLSLWLSRYVPIDDGPAAA